MTSPIAAIPHKASAFLLATNLVAGALVVGAAVPDDGDTPATSTVLEFGIRSEANLESVDDVDVFRMDMQGRAAVVVQSGGDIDTSVSLEDSEGVEIARDDDSGSGFNFRLAETLDGGVYYLTVTGRSVGPYRVLARISRAGDDHGNTIRSSTRLIAAEVAGSIRPMDDVDAFRIDVDVETGARFRTRGPTDTRGQLLDSDGNVLAEADTGGERGNFLIDTSLGRGIYYLLVSAHDAGGYTVEAELDTVVACADQGGEASDPRPGRPQDDDASDASAGGPARVYERLDALVVDVGRIQVGAIALAGCLVVPEVLEDATTYRLLRSGWQRRAEAFPADWVDIEGTERVGQVCPFSPTEPGRYRLTADVEVDGVLRHVASNLLVVR